MKLLWLCNRMPGAVQNHITGKGGSGLWMDHVLEDLRSVPGLSLHILAPGKEKFGRLDENCSYSIFPGGEAHVYRAELEEQFARELDNFAPDVIHIWGTEFPHTRAMVRAAENAGVLSRVAVSIQGLCSVYARHYAEGLPGKVISGASLRDRIRRDNILQQQEKFRIRGENEVIALEKVSHIIGRTDWDRACAAAIQPGATYHLCRETLRKEFYVDQWQYETCRRHSIFASSCAYPVKGFHYLLEALAQVKKVYPDACVTVTGSNFLKRSALRRTGYQNYLASLVEKYGLEDSVTFLGSLGPEEMKRAFLAANVFALPSTIENSPNSLGEAMLLGVPCVAADVGGVTNMLRHYKEGFAYQSTAPYMLAHYIMEVFSMEEEASYLGCKAREAARFTHDPERNLRDLLDIYKTVAGKEAEA